MQFFWSTVPGNLRAAYEKWYLREAWLVSALPTGTKIQRAPLFAERFGLIVADVLFADGPAFAGGKLAEIIFTLGVLSPSIAETFVSGASQLMGYAVVPGFSLESFGKALGTSNASDALAAASSAQLKGRDVLIETQRALEKAAGAEVKKTRLLPFDQWPKHMKDRAFAFMGAPAALYSFLRDVGLSENDAKAYVAGKEPAKKQRVVMVVAPGVGSAPKGGYQQSFAKPLKPKSPTTKPVAKMTATKLAAKPRDRVLSDGERKALTGAALIVGGLVVVGGIYVLATKGGGR